MIAPYSRRDRADEAGSYAERLRTELANLSATLDHYRGRDGAGGLESLRERSITLRRQLQTIASRLNGLGVSADPGKYSLSSHEHAVLNDASDLCELMLAAHNKLQRGDARE